MRKNSTRTTAKAAAGPRSLDIAKAGVKTGADFAALMSALMSDVIENSISPGVANAAVNAGGKLLKVVELQLKYGTPATGNGGKKVLDLCDQPATLPMPQG